MTEHLTLVLFAVALYGSPGPATMSLAASGAARGLRRSLPLLVGILGGLLATLLVAAAGFSHLLAAGPWVVGSLQAVSLTYIGWLALRMARSGGAPEGAHRVGVVEGLLINLLNPKAYAAAFATFSQFCDPAEASAEALAGTVSSLLAVGLVVDIAWCLTGSLLGERLSTPRRRRVLQRTLAAALFASACFAVLSG